MIEPSETVVLLKKALGVEGSISVDRLKEKILSDSVDNEYTYTDNLLKTADGEMVIKLLKSRGVNLNKVKPSVKKNIEMIYHDRYYFSTENDIIFRDSIDTIKRFIEERGKPGELWLVIVPSEMVFPKFKDLTSHFISIKTPISITLEILKQDSEKFKLVVSTDFLENVELESVTGLFDLMLENEINVSDTGSVYQFNRIACRVSIKSRAAILTKGFCYRMMPKDFYKKIVYLKKKEVVKSHDIRILELFKTKIDPKTVFDEYYCLKSLKRLKKRNMINDNMVTSRGDFVLSFKKKISIDSASFLYDWYERYEENKLLGAAIVAIIEKSEPLLRKFPSVIDEGESFLEKYRLSSREKWKEKNDKAETSDLVTLLKLYHYDENIRKHIDRSIVDIFGEMPEGEIETKIDQELLEKNYSKRIMVRARDSIYMDKNGVYFSLNLLNPVYYYEEPPEKIIAFSSKEGTRFLITLNHPVIEKKGTLYIFYADNEEEYFIGDLHIKGTVKVVNDKTNIPDNPVYEDVELPDLPQDFYDKLNIQHQP
ncbi:MAG: hypothetical protein KatS3mg101_0841 [Patescibacteria group bacterium]|nr:MAG: hypothetical protein KatS3mg101_0841 [Patescibacteria group bacterium]